MFGPPLHFPGHTPLASLAPLSSTKGAFGLGPRSFGRRCRWFLGVREGGRGCQRRAGLKPAPARVGGLLDGLEDGFEVVNDFVVPEAEDMVAVLV